MIKNSLEILVKALRKSGKRMADFFFAVALSLFLSVAIESSPTIIIEGADQTVRYLQENSGVLALARIITAIICFLICLVLDHFFKGEK